MAFTYKGVTLDNQDQVNEAYKLAQRAFEKRIPLKYTTLMGSTKSVGNVVAELYKELLKNRQIQLSDIREDIAAKKASGELPKDYFVDVRTGGGKTTVYGAPVMDVGRTGEKSIQLGGNPGQPASRNAPINNSRPSFLQRVEATKTFRRLETLKNQIENTKAGRVFNFVTGGTLDRAKLEREREQLQKEADRYNQLYGNTPLTQKQLDRAEKYRNALTNAQESLNTQEVQNQFNTLPGKIGSFLTVAGVERAANLASSPEAIKLEEAKVEDAVNRYNNNPTFFNKIRLQNELSKINRHIQRSKSGEQIKLLAGDLPLGPRSAFALKVPGAVKFIGAQKAVGEDKILTDLIYVSDEGRLALARGVTIVNGEKGATVLIGRSAKVIKDFPTTAFRNPNRLKDLETFITTSIGKGSDDIIAAEKTFSLNKGKDIVTRLTPERTAVRELGSNFKLLGESEFNRLKTEKGIPKEVQGFYNSRTGELVVGKVPNSQELKEIIAHELIHKKTPKLILDLSRKLPYEYRPSELLAYGLQKKYAELGFRARIKDDLLIFEKIPIKKNITLGRSVVTKGLKSEYPVFKFPGGLGLKRIPLIKKAFSSVASSKQFGKIVRVVGKSNVIGSGETKFKGYIINSLADGEVISGERSIFQVGNGVSQISKGGNLIRKAFNPGKKLLKLAAKQSSELFAAQLAKDNSFKKIGLDLAKASLASTTLPPKLFSLAKPSSGINLKSTSSFNKNKSFNNSRLGGGQIIKENTKLKPIFEDLVSTRETERLISRVKPASLESTSDLNKVRIRSRSDTNQQNRQRQQQRQQQKQVQSQIGSNTNLSVGPKSFIETSIFSKENQKSRKSVLSSGDNKATGYNAFAKEKGKLRKLNTKPLTKQQALDLSAYVVDNSTSAFGKIAKANKPAQAPSERIPLGYYSRTKGNYRPFKIQKGQRINLPDSFIERRKARISTLGEKQQLNIAKSLAKLRKPFFRR